MNYPNPITAILLAALALPMVLVASPSASGTLHLDGILMMHGDRTSTGRVVITPLGAPERIVENVAGHFTLDLSLEQSYMLSFELGGMVTKQVYFDTHVPSEETARQFEFPFKVTLFTLGTNGVRAYSAPVGYVYYQSDIGDFVHRTEYKVAPGTPEEVRMSELMALVSVPEVKPLQPRTAVVAELKWTKHGKRGQLFIGKAFAPDGRLLAEGRFLDAQLQEMHGAFVFYHGNGLVESKGRFEHGKKTGAWQRFDATGRPLAERIYDPEVLEGVGQTKAGMVAESRPVPERVAIPAPDNGNATAALFDAPPAKPRAVAPVVARTIPPVSAKPMVSNTASVTHQVAAATPVTSAVDAAGSERSEELIVERLRVITVVRMQGAAGHTTEYRRVADRYGSVLYFEDGRSIPASIYHARTGR